MGQEFELPPLTLEHGTLIELAKHLGFEKVSDMGLCYGYQSMGSQAALINDLRAFKERLSFIETQLNHYNSIEVFVGNLKQKHEENLKLRQELREDLLRALNLDSTITDKDFYKILETQKQNPEVVKYQDQLNNIEDPLIDLEAFFGLLLINQSPFNYPELFEANSLLKQNVQISYVRTLPDELIQISSAENEIASETLLARQQEKHQVEQIGLVTAKYEFLQLRAFVNCLQENNPPPHPIAISIHSINHSVSIVYDQVEQCWSLIDAGAFPKVKSFKPPFEALDFAIAVRDAFPITNNNNKAIALTMNFSCTENNVEAMNTWYRQLREHPKWKKVYEVINKEQVNKLDIYGGSLLLTAVLQGDLECVNRLFQLDNLDVDLTNHNGFSALHYAVFRENTELVKWLLKHSVDTQKIDGEKPAVFLSLLSPKNKEILNLVEEAISFDKKLQEVKLYMEKLGVNSSLYIPILADIKEQRKNSIPVHDLMSQLVHLEHMLMNIEDSLKVCTKLIQENTLEHQSKLEEILDHGESLGDLLNKLHLFETDLQQMPNNVKQELIESNSLENFNILKDSYFNAKIDHYSDQHKNTESDLIQKMKNTKQTISDARTSSQDKDTDSEYDNKLS